VLLTDALALMLIVAILAAMKWINAVHWDLTLLPGIWERENPCGVHERVELRPGGTVHWEDALGDQAEGRYSVRGNRLDGPLLLLRVTASQGDGKGPCVWFKGMRRNHYFEVSEDRLVYKKRRLHVFTRVPPTRPTSGRSP
jgi:hypothetical protein